MKGFKVAYILSYSIAGAMIPIVLLAHFALGGRVSNIFRYCWPYFAFVYVLLFTGVVFMVVHIIMVSASNPARPVQRASQQPTNATPVNNPAQSTLKSDAPLGNGSKDFLDYNPLPIGIEYDPATFKGEFLRGDGLSGAMPRVFGDKYLPRCPLCQTDSPEWTLAMKNLMSWRGMINFYKCAKCSGTLTVSTLDIKVVSHSATGYVTGQNFVNMAAKKKAGKDEKTVYVAVEYVGSSGVDPAIQGNEFRLEDITRFGER